MVQKKKNSGGARVGAGRKPQVKLWDDKFQKGLWKAANKKAKETGQTPFDVVMDMLYDPSAQDTARIAVFKVMADASVVKTSHNINENHSVKSPRIIELPRLGAKEPERDASGDSDTTIH